MSAATPRDRTAAERELLDQAERWWREHRDEFLDDLAEWIAVPSVSRTEAAEEGAPFGPDIRRIFEHAERTADRYGFASQQVDGHALTFTLGSAERELGLVAHLDVVAPGPGWVHDPFALNRDSDVLIGRGVADDKGPALLDLYLLRFFRDQTDGLPISLRVIYGGAEETGMADLAHYADHGPVPEFSLVTDGTFPVNHAQKGQLIATVRFPPAPEISALTAAATENAVPAAATATVRNELAAELSSLGIEIDALPEGGGFRATASGIGGHAAFPEGTENALGILAGALASAVGVSAESRETFAALRILATSPYGEALGLEREDEISGSLTLNAGVASADSDALRVTLDIRFPVSASADEIVNVLATWARGHAAVIELQRVLPSFSIDSSDERVAVLQKTFEEVTGLVLPSYAMGGGTHSKVLPNAVTFGPGLPGAIERVRGTVPAQHGAPHGPDEAVAFDDLAQAFQVYVLAVHRLATGTAGHAG